MICDTFIPIMVQSGYQHFMRHLAKFIFLLLALTAVPARAEHTTVALLLGAEQAVPGATVLAGVQLEMDPEWHTYWKNPGESGQATEIKWKLPAGVTAGPIQWPIPKKLPPAEITTYGYEGKIILIVPLTLASNLPAGLLKIAARVSWLECKESCVPGSAEVNATVLIGNETKASADAVLLAEAQKKLPGPPGSLVVQAWWEKPATGDTRPMVIYASFLNSFIGKPQAGPETDFYPEASDKFEIQSTREIILQLDYGVQWRQPVKKFEGEWPGEISGLLLIAEGDHLRGVDIKVPVAAGSPAAAMPVPSLWRMLFYAFIGGLILNIMPCVLPVIALKILGFVSEAHSSRRKIRALGGIYAVGILCSFLVLAGLVIGVKAAGSQAGWGMQFGSPVFLVCLITLVTLVALNLFGIFEVTLAGGAMDRAGELASKSGAAGAFFNGVLATILATPCTAPFLGAALGFAFLQPPAIIVLVFLTVGLGLASPYLLLSWNPAWLKFLPKPGAWMEKFKIAMGFPMLATAIWLFGVASSSYGKNIFWLGIFLVIVSLSAWVFGEFFQRGRKRKSLAIILTLSLLGGGYVIALEKQLDWRNPIANFSVSGSLKESADGIDWQPWSPEAVKAARAKGKAVVVDFTADWCLTCQVNKRTSIEIAAVREKIKSLDVVPLLGDYTHFPTNITTQLNQYNRAGVPLVLVFPKNASKPAMVLPEVLTPGIVLDALVQAAK
jgi:thiol:disulfide interchange protein DsbD